MNAMILFLKELLVAVVARTIEPFLTRRSLEESATRFNARIANFNRRLPEVVDKILLRTEPSLQGKVLEVDARGEKRRFAAVPLLDFRPNFPPEKTVRAAPTISDVRDNSVHDPELIEFITKTGRKLWDNDVFRLICMGDSGELTIGTTRFFKALTSCDRFLYQLVREFPTKATPFRLAMLAHRGFVRRWRDDVSKVIHLHQFEHLSAAIGVSVLTVFRRPSSDGEISFCYPCIENSNQKNGACDRHVIPSFIFEPFTLSRSDWTRELDLQYQVLREFGEEVLGIPELQERMLHWKAVYEVVESNQTLRALHSLLQNGHAILRVTGLWLDLLRLRPEITCALIIDDANFYESHIGNFRGSWENNTGVKWSRLDSESEYEALLSDSEIPLCPPGAAAVVAGRAFALQHLASIAPKKAKNARIRVQSVTVKPPDQSHEGQASSSAG